MTGPTPDQPLTSPAKAPAPAAIALCEDLTVAIGSRVVLDRQTFAVNPGEVTVLMGPSGVGKSVLADVLFGLNGPGGAIRWTGQPKAARGIGALVFQSGGGLPHVTAADNLALVSDSRDATQRMLEAFHLDPRQGCAHLSGGEQRRLASARALVAGRRLLWLDEPAAGLDVVRTDALARQLREEAGDRGVAVVVTSHRASFTTAVADRVIFLGFDGKLRDLGRPTAPADLEATLRDAIRSAPQPSSTRPSKVWAFIETLLRPVSWIGTWARAIVDTLFGAPVASRVATKTLGHALRIAAVEGAIFYLIVGAIFGLIFLLIFELSLPFMDTAEVIQEFGPTVIHRLSPAFAGVLAAARAGSAISAWLGQMTVTRQLDALKVLGVNVHRHVIAPIWLGLSVASLVGTVLFAGALTAIFGGYLHLEAPCADGLCGDALPPLDYFIQTTLGDAGRYALAKAAFFGTVVGAITVGFAAARKRRPDEVATAITRGIVHATIWIMIFEVVVLGLQATQP